MLSDVGVISETMTSPSSAEHDIQATADLVTSQYANLVQFRQAITDISVDHSADIENMALWIDGHMVSAQDAYDTLYTTINAWMADESSDPDSAIPIVLVDKETGNSFTTSTEVFFNEFNAACDSAAISAGMLQQAAVDVTSGVISTADTMRSNLQWALGSIPAEVSNTLNSAIQQIYSGAEDPVDLFFNIKNFLGLDSDMDDASNIFDPSKSELGKITGTSPIVAMCSGIATGYVELLKASGRTIAKSVVHRYYVGKFLFTVIKESYRLQWKASKWILKKIGNKLRTTYVDPVDYECKGGKVGYFDVQQPVNVDPFYSNLWADYLSSGQIDIINNFKQYVVDNGPITVEMFGNEFQVGLRSNNMLTIVHRQKPFDYASVVERMGKELGKNDWTLQDFATMMTLYTRVADMKEGTDEQYVLNSLSFARAHCGCVLMYLKEMLKKINNTSNYGDDHTFTGTYSSWTGVAIEKSYLDAVYQGYVFGKCMIDGTYPISSGNHDVLTPSSIQQQYADVYHEYAGTVNNKDFLNVLTSYSVGIKGTSYNLGYGCSTTTYYENNAYYLIPRFKISTDDTYGIGRMYLDLILVLGYLLTESKFNGLSCLKYYKGTSRFEPRSKIKTDKDNLRSALIFTGAIAATVLITIAAIKLTPALIKFRNHRRLLAEEYNTRAFNIGQKIIDGDKEGALADLKLNKKTKRFLNLTGGSSGLISSGMSIAAIDASGVIDRLNESITTIPNISELEDDLSNVSDDISSKLDDVVADVNEHTDDELSSVSRLIKV